MSPAESATPDPHAYRPERYRVWGWRHFKFHWRCSVEGCNAPPEDHPADE